MHRYTESPTKYSDSDWAGSAITESLDEDTDFEFGEQPLELASRLESTKTVIPQQTFRKKPSKALLFQEQDDFGLGIDGINISKDTANDNVVFGTIEPPRRKLRAATSMYLQGDEHATIKLRPAKSMWEIPKQQAPQVPQVDICHRPLTVYTERSKPQKQRDSRKKMGHIKPAAHTRKEINGMVFNPDSGVWEGDDVDLSAFDTIRGRKEMLLQQQDLLPSQSATMLFDAKNLCWVPREGTENDPFAGIEDLADTVSTASSTPNLRQSIMSNASSARREISTPADVFMVPISVQRLWQENDLRFMRKFGRWIEGDGGNHAAANDLFKMVN